jgi:PAT family beta-lactamase induction signal transducer AmpG
MPWLTARLGRRRGWLIATQLLLIATILFLGTRDPVSAPLAVGLGALLVAFASATQDIVIDAFRVESLRPEEQAAGMASYVAAYRVGMLASGAGVVALTAWLELKGFDKAAVWPIGYAVAAVLVIVGLLAVLVAPEPRRRDDGAPSGSHALAASLRRRGAFADFSPRCGARCPRLRHPLQVCDALAGAMTAPFVLVALAYDKATYAAIVKGLGLAALLIGGFAGGSVARALPLVTTLWLGAILQMVSNLAFVWLWLQPPSAWALTLAIVIENFTGAIGTVIFVAYLSALCGNPLHTATQYALLTALASTGRTLLREELAASPPPSAGPAFFICGAVGLAGAGAAPGCSAARTSLTSMASGHHGLIWSPRPDPW